MQRSNRLTLHREAGFTLLEMLVVLAIVGGLMSVVIALVKPRGEVLALRQVSMDIASGLRAARSDAVWKNDETVFSFDAENRLFQGTAGTKIIALPTDMAVTLETARTTGDANTDSRFRFFGDGSSTGGKIVLRGAEKEIRITVEWLTGAVRIDEPLRR